MDVQIVEITQEWVNDLRPVAEEMITGMIDDIRKDFAAEVPEDVIVMETMHAILTGSEGADLVQQVVGAVLALATALVRMARDGD